MVLAESGGERPLGSPYSGGMASPYSDVSVGLPSPPTVVSDYNRPYDCVNTDGPHLILTEQPQSKFRFRYKSEMVGTHGQLKAERADRNKPIFPTVKLAKWSDGPAVVRLALYTGEDNPNQRRRHVHELSGKNCDKDTGMCEVVVDHTTDYTATFQNLGIIHIAKRDVKDIIRQRKKAELIEHARLRRPHCTQEEIRQSITPTDLKKFDEEAEEIAKAMDLNKVVLRFQAFQYDTTHACYRPITRAVDSELVVNLKNASTGELKIVRISQCSAPCTGGTEVWMLVEKVKKTNIKIRFFECDADGNEVWSAYGEFSEADVHHQYAIIFRTPPYHSTNLRSPAHVKIQLERPNDRDISEPRDFTYYPSNRKRQSPFMESARLDEDEDYPQGGGDRTKRMCHGSYTEPLDLRFSEFPSKHASSDDVFNKCGECAPNFLAPDRGSCSRGRARASSGSALPSQSWDSQSQHSNLFRTEFERLVELREQNKSQTSMNLMPKYSSSMLALSDHNKSEAIGARSSHYCGGSGFLSLHEPSIGREQSCSQDSLIESFARDCTTESGHPSTSMVKAEDQFRSTYVSAADNTHSHSSQAGHSFSLSHSLGSSPTPQTPSPVSSPYRKFSVDNDFRLMTGHSKAARSSVPEAAGDGKASQTLGMSSLPEYPGISWPKPDECRALEYHNYDNIPNATSLPNLIPDQSGGAGSTPPTYAELQPVQHHHLRPPLQPIQTTPSLDSHAKWGVGASPPPHPVNSPNRDQASIEYPRRSSAPNISGPCQTPTVTITPPAEFSPFSSFFWNTNDDILE
ncbi:uncharacterized protein LOC108674175 isoform X2 [Hyalella azteca]|uniref:Uncharacterized protein LOC108674175 isoform X2 n=1 Tax=Hyalella azteca TaxID=294128 RepID=A0A8B7NXG9_HYAAZ|nr:uncharacterized protein LOC108674175 isoform X2 [Hyalella azteca]